LLRNVGIAGQARAPSLEARVSTLGPPTLGEIHALTVAIDGTVFVATASALYIISTLAGFVGHLAGSRSETGYADGEGADALFNHP